MKKYFFLLGISIFGMSNSQTLVWENTFDTSAEVAGWQFYDGNSNNNTWNVGKHVVRKAASPNMYEEQSPDHVLRYSRFIPNVVGSPANYKPDYLNDFEDWAISPEIDLTGASGAITLAAMVGRVIAYNTTSTSNNTSRDIFVYESTSAKPVPDVTDFQALRASIITAYDNGANPSVKPPVLSITNADYIAEGNALFAQATADLSQYAGKKIYIGFWNNINFSDNPEANFGQPFLNTNSSATFQMDELQIYADVYTMATADVKKASISVYPNPATDVLFLKGISKANATVYSTAGQVVSKKAITNGQLNVSALPKGVYTVSVETDGKVSTTKFIKK